MTFTNEISKAFNTQAAEYETVAKVQLEIGQRLFERLQYLKIQPQRILDLGCGPGSFSRELSLLYPKAHVVGLDLAHAMLLEAKKKQSWRRKWSLTTADMHCLPFASGVFDLVFSNQVIHWGQSMSPVFRELNRVLSVNGCFMFTTLGPDTFHELKTAWSGVNEHAHVNEFVDMHDVGDALLKELFLEPVMDMELLSIHYRSLSHLVRALKAQGVKNIHTQRNKGLTGRQTWQQFERNYARLKTTDDKYPLTYEVVYGHAWKGAKQISTNGIETFIPITSLSRKKS